MTADPPAGAVWCPDCTGLGYLDRAGKPALGQTDGDTFCDRCEGSGRLCAACNRWHACLACHDAGKLRDAASCALDGPSRAAACDCGTGTLERLSDWLPCSLPLADPERAYVTAKVEARRAPGGPVRS